MQEYHFSQLIWVVMVGAVANMVPVILARWQVLESYNRPIDCGSGLLGPHKTIRGLVGGIAAGTVFGVALLPIMIDWPVLESASVSALLSSAALGFDLLKSFVKRRLSIKPGGHWWVFDQVDWVVGSLFVTLLFFDPTVLHVFYLLCFFSLLSFVVSVIGYALGIKKNI